jgi:pilus assembly protein CpaC
MRAGRNGFRLQTRRTRAAGLPLSVGVSALSLFLLMSHEAVAGKAYAPSASTMDSGGIRVLTSTGGTRLLKLSPGKSAILQLPADLTDVIIGNPGVVDAVIRSKRHVYLVGMGQGETNALFLGADGGEIGMMNIDVAPDLLPLERALKNLLPKARIKPVAMANNTIVLTGEVRSAMEAAHALSIAQRFANANDAVVNLLKVNGNEQVLLTVTIAEVNRTALQRLGIDWRNMSVSAGAVAAKALSAHAFPLTSGWAGPASLTDGVLNSGGAGTAAAVNYATTGLQASALIQMLQRTGSLKTLAEPVLTAISGETANFLAGGEFPIPVAKQNDQTSIEWKSFGVGLSFTPIVLDEGRISLKITTDASELSSEGAVQSAGISIPAIRTRRVSTTVELPHGGALVLAGLISEETRRNVDAAPGLSRLPILGPFFESRDYVNAQKELMVIVAPYLAKSASRLAFAPESHLMQDALTGGAGGFESKAGWKGHLEPVPRRGRDFAPVPCHGAFCP